MTWIIIAVVALVAIIGLGFVKKAEISQEITEKAEPIVAGTPELFESAPTKAVIDVVNRYNSEIKRISEMPAEEVNAEIKSGHALAESGMPPIIQDYPLSEAAEAAGAEAYETQRGETVISYPVEREMQPKNIYGVPVKTKAEALEAAERQYRIASRNPGHPAMMAIAESYFAYAEKMVE